MRLRVQWRNWDHSRSQLPYSAGGVPPLAAGVGDVQQPINDFAKVCVARPALARGCEYGLDESPLVIGQIACVSHAKDSADGCFPRSVSNSNRPQSLNVQIFHILRIVNQILTAVRHITAH